MQAEVSELPVILITDQNDPILNYLERENLFAQRIDITESSEWLQDGIEQLWFRSPQMDTDVEGLKPLLCENGVSVFECYFNSDKPELAFGTLQTVI
jgi:hypothetical protein